MPDGSVAPDLRYVVVLGLLVLAAVAVAGLTGLGTARASLTASLRAGAQLLVVAGLIVVVLRSWWTTAAFVVVMFTVASLTSARRIGRLAVTGWAGLAIAAGAAGPLILILVAGVVPAAPVSVIPIVGIVVGGAMTATSLAGRGAIKNLEARFGEYEAALALGFSGRDAAMLICRPAARDALVPALDQTRTVGLVTLPGAFVGVLLGGGSPLQAGAVQLLVLLALLAAETTSAVVTLELVARKRIPWAPRGQTSYRRRPVLGS